MGMIKQFFSNAGTLLADKTSAVAGSIKDTAVNVYRTGTQGVQELWERQAIIPKWYFSAILGQPRSINIQQLREFAQSAWAQMVINTIKKQVFTIKWDIVPVDEEDENDYSAKIKIIKDKLNSLNNNRETISCLNASLISDISEIDAGVVNYVYTMDSYDIGMVPVYDSLGREMESKEGLILKPLGQRELSQIKTVDGGSVLKQIDIYKNLLGYYQYSFKHPTQNPTKFEVDEIGYLLMNVKPYDIYGFSPIQSIQQVLEFLIQGTRYNKDFFTNNAVPDTLITMPKLDDDALKRLKRNWNKSYKGKPHQVGFVNWAADKIHQLSSNNRDMEWLEGQKWYSKIVFASFGLSPVEAGFFENSNKSNDEGQERSTVRNAIKPYLKLLEDLHTSRTITEILQEENHGLKFKFFPKDHAIEKIEFEQDMKEIENNILTINEYRKKKGRKPVAWGDEPVNNNSNNQEDDDSSMNQNDQEDEVKDKPEEKPKTKKLDILAGEDIVEKSKGYSDFLLNLFDKMERKVLQATSSMVTNKSYTEKSFGEFLQGLFNAVNTAAFAKYVRRYIKQDLMQGLQAAEKELDMDIGATNKFNIKIDVLAEQQINGYTINGKKWHGIKGVTREIQQKIIRTVQQGVSEDKTIDEMRDAIKNDFANFSDWRAEMIARTETNRIINEGKLVGYKESGLKGVKVWKTSIDNRTSPICRRLQNDTVDLDSPFIDEKTMKEYMTPPAHPNCRSTLAFRPN